jgi:hypothetical protein
MLGGRGSRHSRITVAEQTNVRYADLAHRLAQLPFADGAEPLGVVEASDGAFPGFAPSRADDRDRYTALDRRGHDAGSAECLIVRMGEDCQHGPHQTNSPVRASVCSSRDWRSLAIR